GGEPQRRPGPDFVNLLVAAKDRPIGRDAVDRAHRPAREAGDVERVDLLERRSPHPLRDEIPQAGQVGVPLAGELVGDDVVLVIAAGVVAEVLTGPELVDEAALGTLEEAAELPGASATGQARRDLLSRSQRREVEAAR